MIMDLITDVYLDFYQNPFVSVYAKQNDNNTRFLRIHCSKNGEFFPVPTGYRVDIKILTPDNRHLLYSPIINTDGTLQFELTQSILLKPGRCEAEVIVYNATATERISTMNFQITVQGEAYGDDVIVDSDEFHTLMELYEKLGNITYEVISDEKPELASGNFWDKVNIDGDVKHVVRNTISGNKAIPISHWTLSDCLEFEDGKNAEEKLGAINGITSDMSIDRNDICLSASAGKYIAETLADMDVRIDDIHDICVEGEPSDVNIPEINDDITNRVDTWSSSKISEELESIREEIRAIIDGIPDGDKEAY